MRYVARAAVTLSLCLLTQIAVAQEAGLGGGVGYGGPIGAAVTAELVYGLRADVDDDGDRVRGLAGLLVQVHAGSGGGKLSLGVGGRARVDTDDFRAPASAGAVLSLARTWGSPVGTAPGLTYLGPEVQLSAMHVGLTLGPLFRIAGGHGPAVLFSFGVGVRF
jgi:hypothetical protein